MARYAHIVGWGMAVPDRVLTNHELARMVDTNDEWIVSRTGIRERRIAAEHDTTAALATHAARQALDVANVSPSEIDLIIVATATPDYVAFPSTASLVQDALGCANAGAFDLAAACTGFIYALNVGSQAIRAGDAENVLVIGAEVLSRFINWQDRSTCILFGDGAGAFLLRASEHPGGILSAVTRSDGSGSELLMVPAGGCRLPPSYETLRDNLHSIQMNGREVFRFATRVIVSACKDAAHKAGISMDDIDIIVPHQANTRIIETAARMLNIPTERFFLNLDRYGNTSAASIPIATCEAIAAGRIGPNSKVMFVGFGGGLTWGATVVHWQVAPPPPLSRWERLQRTALYRTARVRSAIRRGSRLLEGLIWGRLSDDGHEPPRTRPPETRPQPEEDDIKERR